MIDKIVKSVQDMYDQTSIDWSNTRSKILRSDGSQNWPVTQKYLDLLHPGDTVLDIGCGNGRLVSGLPTGVGYVGIDFSRGLLEEARKNFPGYEFRYGNVIDKESFANLDTYSALFCVAVLHHIPERTQHVAILTRMKHVAAPHGFLFLSVWNLWQEKFLQHHLDSLELKKTNPRWLEVPFQNKWKRFCFQMDLPYLTDILTESGWDVTEIFYADKEGARADIQTGHNLVAIAR